MQANVTGIEGPVHEIGDLVRCARRQDTDMRLASAIAAVVAGTIAGTSQFLSWRSFDRVFARGRFAVVDLVHFTLLFAGLAALLAAPFGGAGGSLFVTSFLLPKQFGQKARHLVGVVNVECEIQTNQSYFFFTRRSILLQDR